MTYILTVHMNMVSRLLPIHILYGAIGGVYIYVVAQAFNTKPLMPKSLIKREKY